ncbi:MAG: hypothetical protein IM551_06700 [Chitinophagaceae bacterium]|nr:hypothetical protein [Chitinophagaceae bacterium]
MDAIEKRISKLEEQKEKIQKEIEDLAQKRNQELLSVLDKLPLQNLDTMTLVGGLLHVVAESGKNPTTKEMWQKEGQKFCKRTIPQKTNRPLKKAA